MQKAHICAIASRAGVNLAFEGEFDYGTDGRFTLIAQDENNKCSETGAELCFQLKATTRASINDERVSFIIKTVDYNKLLKRSSPIMLVLLILPPNENEWGSFLRDEMVLRKRCFWKYLTDKTPKLNKHQITITIPIENVLTPEKVRADLEAIEKKNLTFYDDMQKQLSQMRN